MEAITVVINSLEDARNGKPIIEGLTPEKQNVCEDITMAILEGGMKSGKTSIMIIMKDKKGQHHIGQMSARHMHSFYHAMMGAMERFNDKIE